MIIKPYYTTWFYSPRSLWGNIIETFRWLWYILIRGLYGWCSRDAWGLHYHLSIVLIGTLGWLRDNHTGYPCDCPYETDKLCKCEEKWSSVLVDMVDGFKAGLELYDKCPIDPGKERKFDKAMKLLYKHYFALSD